MTKVFDRTEFLETIGRAVQAPGEDASEHADVYTEEVIVATARELGADEATIQRALRSVARSADERPSRGRLRSWWGKYKRYKNARAIGSCL
jgi:hypothetical protein